MSTSATARLSRRTTLAAHSSVDLVRCCARFAAGRRHFSGQGGDGSLAAMGWWRLLLAGFLVAFSLAGGGASAATRPSDRACLLAWNAPSNRPLQLRVAAGAPWSRAMLGSATTTGITWEQGSAPTHSTAQSCVMALQGPARSRLVVGIWGGGESCDGRSRAPWGRLRCRTAARTSVSSQTGG